MRPCRRPSQPWLPPRCSMPCPATCGREPSPPRAWGWTMRADILLLALTVLATGCVSASPTPCPSASLSYSERPEAAPALTQAPREEVPPKGASSRTAFATSMERERMARHQNVREAATGEGLRGRAGARATASLTGTRGRTPGRSSSSTQDWMPRMRARWSLAG